VRSSDTAINAKRMRANAGFGAMEGGFMVAGMDFMALICGVELQ
jgi:hypothetical protein